MSAGADPRPASRPPAVPGAWRMAAAAQGGYYLVTGAWPLLHMGSFLAVTGPKRELWLVRAVGASLAALGAGLLAARRLGRLDGAWALAAGSTAAGLAAVDTGPGGPWRISRLYLLDAVAQAGLAGLWAAGARGRRAGAAQTAQSSPRQADSQNIHS